MYVPCLRRPLLPLRSRPVSPPSVLALTPPRSSYASSPLHPGAALLHEWGLATNLFPLWESFDAAHSAQPPAKKKSRTPAKKKKAASAAAMPSAGASIAGVALRFGRPSTISIAIPPAALRGKSVPTALAEALAAPVTAEVVWSEECGRVVMAPPAAPTAATVHSAALAPMSHLWEALILNRARCAAARSGRRGGAVGALRAEVLRTGRALIAAQWWIVANSEKSPRAVLTPHGLGLFCVVLRGGGAGLSTRVSCAGVDGALALDLRAPAATAVLDALGDAQCARAAGGVRLTCGAEALPAALDALADFAA